MPGLSGGGWGVMWTVRDDGRTLAFAGRSEFRISRIMHEPGSKTYPRTEAEAETVAQKLCQLLNAEGLL